MVFYSKDACGHTRVAFGAFVSCFESHVPRAYMTVLFNVAHKPIQKIWNPPTLFCYFSLHFITEPAKIKLITYFFFFDLVFFYVVLRWPAYVAYRIFFFCLICTNNSFFFFFLLLLNRWNSSTFYPRSVYNNTCSVHRRGLATCQFS